jgi:hypothetical protein
MQAVAAELADWVPAANIRIGPDFEGKFDAGRRAAVIEPQSCTTQRVFNTLTWVINTIAIHLVFGDLDHARRHETIERIAVEIRDHFEKNISAFADLPGYCDTRTHRIEFDSPIFHETPGRTASALIRLDCIVEENPACA